MRDSPRGWFFATTKYIHRIVELFDLTHLRLSARGALAKEAFS
jgi:hypothetical protein